MQAQLQLFEGLPHSVVSMLGVAWPHPPAPVVNEL